MTDPADAVDAERAVPRTDEELISRLRIIEEQPLAERAAAYGALHADLARELDSGPADVRRG